MTLRRSNEIVSARHSLMAFYEQLRCFFSIYFHFTSVAFYKLTESDMQVCKVRKSEKHSQNDFHSFISASYFITLHYPFVGIVICIEMLYLAVLSKYCTEHFFLSNFLFSLLNFAELMCTYGLSTYQHEVIWLQRRLKTSIIATLTLLHWWCYSTFVVVVVVRF